MKRLEYRIWDKERKDLFDVISIDFFREEVQFHRQSPDERDSLNWIISKKFFSEVVIMQWTGLKDKNGIKIFEGDYLMNDTNRICEIVWLNAASAFDAVPINNLGTAKDFNPQNWHKCEIIGNKECGNE